MPEDAFLDSAVLLDRKALNEERVLQERATANAALALYSDAAASAGDPTTVLINRIAEQVAVALGFNSGSQEFAELHGALVAQLRRVDLKAAGLANAGPSTAGGLLRLLRRSSGSSFEGPPDDAEIRALATIGPDLIEQVFGMRLSDMRVMFDAADWFPEPEPEDPDAEIDEEAQLLLDTIGYPEDPDSVDPDPSPGPTPRAGLRFPKILRWISADYADLIRAHRRNLNKFNDVPHTSAEGRLAEQIIRAHYVIANPASSLMFDYNIFNGKGQPSTYLGDASGAVWAVVKLALKAANAFFKPDILDETKREVYEIKPIGQLAAGAVQLFLRYLVPLNLDPPVG